MDEPNTYGKLVRRLTYLTINGPETTYIVQLLSQFMHAPADEHIKAAKHAVRHLKSAPGSHASLTVILIGGVVVIPGNPPLDIV